VRRRSVLVVAALASLALWRRKRGRDYAEIAYDDGSLLRLERGVEARDLVRDAREILDAAAG
jgi:hypothetical protein